MPLDHVRVGGRAGQLLGIAVAHGEGRVEGLVDVGPDHHDLTLRLYLLEMAVRYVDALTHGATPALLRRTSWVLSVLERLDGEVTGVYDEPTRRAVADSVPVARRVALHRRVLQALVGREVEGVRGAGAGPVDVIGIIGGR